MTKLYKEIIYRSVCAEHLDRGHDYEELSASEIEDEGRECEECAGTTTTDERAGNDLYMTTNGYVLCFDHLGAWRRAGNDVGAHALTDAERAEIELSLESPRCQECNDDEKAYADAARLAEVAATLTDFGPDTWSDIGPHLTCTEANAIAHVLNLLDLDVAAEALRDGHALGDDDETDDPNHTERAAALNAADEINHSGPCVNNPATTDESSGRMCFRCEKGLNR
jgi:hypothetical protein